MAEDRFVPLGSALERVIGDLGSRSSMLELHGQWPAIVGSAISEHCRPRKLDADRLIVEVDHPGWATEIRYLERQILERLAEVLPELGVTTLSISVAR